MRENRHDDSSFASVTRALGLGPLESLPREDGAHLSLDVDAGDVPALGLEFAGLKFRDARGGRSGVLWRKRQPERRA